jgi:hypothetical protein
VPASSKIIGLVQAVPHCRVSGIWRVLYMAGIVERHITGRSQGVAHAIAR